jgi:hypothetical protein
MPDRYWVGGTAPWDGAAGTKWSATSGGAGGASVPTSADDVFFTNLSTGTVTIATGNTGARSINCTGFAGTITGTAAITVSGSITLSAAMGYTHTGTVTFNATATLRTEGKPFSALTVSGAGITLTLGDALNIGSRTLSVSAGTLDTAGYAVTCGTWVVSSGATATLNASSIASSGDLNISSGATINAGASVITGTRAGGSFALGGKTYHEFRLSGPASALAAAVSGSNTFFRFVLPQRSAVPWSLINVSGTQTIGTLVSTPPTSTAFRFGISGGTLNVAAISGSPTAIDFAGVAVTGGAAPLAVSECGDLGGNSGIAFHAPRNLYFVSGSVYGATSGAAWAATSGGAATIAFPCAQDVAIIDNNSPSSVTYNANNSGYRVGKLDATARTTAFTLTYGPASNGCEHYDDFLLSPACTLAQSGSPTFRARKPAAAGTFKFATPTFSTSSSGINLNLEVANPLELLSDVRLNGLSMSGRTFVLNGYTASVVSASITSTSAIDWGGGTIEFRANSTVAFSSAMTFVGTGTVRMAHTAAVIFSGGSKSYAALINASAFALTIENNNSFGSISNTVANAIFQFASGSTQTVNAFAVSGAPGSLATLRSTTPGSRATISDPSGIVSRDYLLITDINATGGASWYAGANSSNGGNNSGWVFSAPPAAVSTNFFIMMR